MLFPSPRKTWPIWRGLIWLVALGALVFTGPDRLKLMRPADGDIMDFFQEYASAKNWLDGKLPVYTNQELTIPLYVRGADGKPVLRDREHRMFVAYNAHPPTAVLIALPFAKLSYSDAFFAWNIATLVVLVVTLGIVAYVYRRQFSWWMVAAAAVLLLLFHPLWNHLLLGQLSMLIALFVAATWALSRSGRPGWAGSMLAIAATIKVFPAVLFLYFVIRRQWNALLWGTVTALAVTGATFAVLGQDTFRDYLKIGLPQTAGFRSGWRSVSFYGFFCKLFDPALGDISKSTDLIDPPPGELSKLANLDGQKKLLALGGGGGDIRPVDERPDLARALTGACSLIALGIWGWMTWNSRRRVEYDLSFAAGVVTMLLVSPIAWNHYLVILIAPLVIFLRRVPQFMLLEMIVASFVFVSILAGVAMKSHPKAAALVPLLALASIPLAFVSPWIASWRKPLTWVVCLLAPALLAAPDMYFEKFVPGGEFKGTAEPAATLTVLSTHFYALLGLLALGWAEFRRVPRLQAIAVTEEGEQTILAAAPTA